MNDVIMPFGKYKGKELVEVISTDPNYIEWLKTQDWLKEDFKQQIININVNGLNQKQDSPEHNYLQNYVYCNIENYDGEFKKYIPNFSRVKELEIEKKLDNYFVDIFARILIWGEGFEWVKINPDDLYSQEKKVSTGMEEWGYNFIFEVKPCIGDDFMSYIRQISKYSFFRSVDVEDKKFLFYKDFKVSNLSFAEVEKIFNSKNIYLIKINEVAQNV